MSPVKGEVGRGSWLRIAALLCGTWALAALLAGCGGGQTANTPKKDPVMDADRQKVMQGMQRGQPPPGVGANQFPNRGAGGSPMGR